MGPAGGHLAPATSGSLKRKCKCFRSPRACLFKKKMDVVNAHGLRLVYVILRWRLTWRRLSASTTPRLKMQSIYIRHAAAPVCFASKHRHQW